MADPNTIALIRLSLLSLAALSVYTMWIPGYSKGFFPDVGHTVWDGLVSRDSDIKILGTIFPFNASLDHALHFMLVLYWPLCTRQTSTLSVLAFQFASTMTVYYVLAALDLHRNTGTRSSASMAWRLVFLGLGPNLASQAMTFAIYGAVDLAGAGPLRPAREANPASTSTSPPSQSASAAPFRSITYLKTILVLSEAIWALILMLPHPNVVSAETRQSAVLFIAVYTIWLCLLLWAVCRFGPVNGLGSRPRSTWTGSRDSLYALALAPIVVCHVVPFFLSGVSVWDALVPVAPWKIVRFASVAEGMTTFIQWDHWISSLSLLLWAVGVYVRDSGEEIQTGKLIMEALGLSVMLSPVGAAVVFVWRLDRALGARVKAE